MTRVVANVRKTLLLMLKLDLMDVICKAVVDVAFVEDPGGDDCIAGIYWG